MSYEANEITVVEAVVPTIMAVGCSQSFVEMCRRATTRAGVIVEPVLLDGLATLVASRKPLVLVIQRDIYDFDPSEFDLLARDVSSSLVIIENEDMAFQALERRLSEGVHVANRRRQTRS